MKVTITLLLVLFTSIATFGQTTETRYYNGKYTKETALKKVNEYLKITQSDGRLKFGGGASSTYQINGIWELKINEKDKIVVGVRYLIEDKSLSISIVSVIVHKDGGLITLSPKSTNEAIREAYDNQVNLFTKVPFDYLMINENTTNPIANTTTTTGSNTSEQTTETRYFNGKYTKETALKKANDFFNLKNGEKITFTKMDKKSDYQFIGNWIIKSEAENLQSKIEYLFEDNRVTIKIKEIVLNDKEGALKMDKNHKDEVARKTAENLYVSINDLFVKAVFAYLGIENNTTPTNTTAVSANTDNGLAAKDACISGDCINGFGKKRYANGETVEGFFENGKVNGIATHTLSNGNYYIGNFKDDYYDGYGIYSWKSEEMIYYGNWQKVLQNGYGYQLKNSKAVVAGYYTNGKLTRDMLTYDYTNNIYKNNCAGDCANGFGQYKYSDSSWYYGFFKDGKLHYVGAFKNDAGLYMGEFKTNRMEGMGTLRYKASGEYYVGEFANGSLNGKGYKTDKNLIITNHGIWTNGKLMGNTNSTTTTAGVNTDNDNPYSGMSTEAAAYLASYKINPNGLKKYLGNQHKSWEDKGYSAEKITQSYADMFKEVYAKDKKAAFELIIHMPDSWLQADKLKSVFSLLTKEQQLYIQDEANRR